MRKTVLPDIGGKLLALRRGQGRTLEQVATALRASTSTINNVEHGKTQPSLAFLSLLAEEYGTTLSAIFAPEQQDVPAEAQIFTTRFAHRLSSKDWEVLATVAEALCRR
jgi:transcriptional regulator with XRE-family HTH domain